MRIISNRKLGCQLLLTFSLLAVLACERQKPTITSEDLSLFAFIISDNDLDDHTDYLEKDMVKGLKGCPVGTELFLYIDRQNTSPSIRHLLLLESGKVGVNTIADYEDQCSTSPDIFQNVLNTMIRESSGSRYGLIYWSHGSGWLPGNSSAVTSNKKSRALGVDGNSSMSINDFSEILSRTKPPFFVVLDACNMGSVEVAYALRNSTHFLIASPSETYGVGFPFYLMLPELVKGTKESLSYSLDLYLDFCNTDFYGDGEISGMASLIDCSQMDDLSNEFRLLYEKSRKSVDINELQSFDNSTPHIYYDFGDYAFNLGGTAFPYERFEDQLNKTVVHKVHTPFIFTQSGQGFNKLKINKYSGLSTYIYGASSLFDMAYERTDWYKVCYEKQ